MKRAAAREGLPEGRQADTGGEWRGMKRRGNRRGSKEERERWAAYLRIYAYAREKRGGGEGRAKGEGRHISQASILPTFVHFSRWLNACDEVRTYVDTFTLVATSMWIPP